MGYNTGTIIPSPTAIEPQASWVALDPDEKRERLLEAATEAGIGVGSLYRCYRSKGDLIAAIVVQQMEELRAEVSSAHRAQDAGRALERTLRQLVDRQATNKLLRAALAATSDRREVRIAVGEVSLAWQELLDRARRQGSIRGDATVSDLRLIFAAAGAADEVERGGRGRMLELLLEAMRRAPGDG